MFHKKFRIIGTDQWNVAKHRLEHLQLKFFKPDKIWELSLTIATVKKKKKGEEESIETSCVIAEMQVHLMMKVCA